MTTIEQIIEQIEVFFVDNANGWACARFDEDGTQVGEAEYYFHRIDAIIGAKCMAGDAGCDTPIVVFRKDGSRGATL